MGFLEIRSVKETRDAFREKVFEKRVAGGEEPGVLLVGVPRPLHERLAEGVALENGERVAAIYLAGEMGLAAGRKTTEYEKRRVSTASGIVPSAASSTATSRWSQRERGFCARARSGRRLRSLPGDADESRAGVDCHRARELRYEQLFGREARLQAAGQLLVPVPVGPRALRRCEARPPGWARSLRTTPSARSLSR